MAEGTRIGKSFHRVHVVTSPLSPYLEYEFAWGYVFNVRAGEDVRILDLAHQVNPGVPAQDFWLFDDTTVVRMDYAPDGTQLRRELLEGVDPTPYMEWKRLALDYAEPFTTYYAKL